MFSPWLNLHYFKQQTQMLTSCFQASLVPYEIFIDTQQSSSWNTANTVFPFSKRNVNCSHKLYLSLSFTHNKHINSNLYKQEATMCKLSTICWITFFKQTLCNLLCEPWYCPVWINCTYSLLPLIPEAWCENRLHVTA